LLVRYPKSVFICGRSGTGKTTVITTRLLQKEQRFKAALAAESASLSAPNPEAEEGAEKPHLRQLMVTLSPKLCAAIRQSLARTMRSLEATERGTDGEQAAKKMGEDARRDCCEEVAR
jgi:type IV secretory pathway ATPase VirB11/archaellum biosynthesis ATPase